MAEFVDNKRCRYAAALSRLITDYLSEIYVSHDVVISDDRELASWGVDPEVFELVYNGWKEVIVSERGVMVQFA